MFDTILNKIFSKKKENKKREIPFFRDLSPQKQESLVANFTFFTFERFMQSLTVVTIINSFYSAGIKNVDRFGYQLEKEESKAVLKIMMHQILQCVLQVYFNSVVYKYYRSFYISVYVAPNVKNGVSFISFDKLVSINNLINLLDIARTKMPIFKLFEERGHNALILDKVVDVNEIAVKMFSYTESMASTFSREIVQDSINVFVRDYFQALKEHKNGELVCSFFAIYAIFFNERFSRIFYTEDNTLKLVKEHSVTAELNIAIAIYDYLIQDIKDGILNFDNISPSFLFKEDNKKKNFSLIVKKEVGLFIDKVSAIKLFIEESKMNSVSTITDHGVNVIDLTSVFRKNQKLATINKELDDIKGKL